MSYGRNPYYIIGTKHNDNNIIQIMEPRGSIERGVWPYKPSDREGKGAFINVPENAMAQFIAHLAFKGSEAMQRWVDLGVSLDDDYNNFYKNHTTDWVREDHKEYRDEFSGLQIVVTRNGQKLK